MYGMYIWGQIASMNSISSHSDEVHFTKFQPTVVIHQQEIDLEMSIFGMGINRYYT